MGGIAAAYKPTKLGTPAISAYARACGIKMSATATPAIESPTHGGVRVAAG